MCIIWNVIEMYRCVIWLCHFRDISLNVMKVISNPYLSLRHITDGGHDSATHCGQYCVNVHKLSKRMSTHCEAERCQCYQIRFRNLCLNHNN